ncbi:MAG TPA: hypothetical protein VF318_04940 [Dehalococcoidales bacterium]
MQNLLTNVLVSGGGGAAARAASEDHIIERTIPSKMIKTGQST